MSETTEQRTKRKFKKTLTTYAPTQLTSIQFTEDATPDEVIEFLSKLKKHLRYHHRSPTIYWLRTNRTHYKAKYPMICIFTVDKLNPSLINTQNIEDIMYRSPLQKEWNEDLTGKWLDNKEMFNNELFQQFFELKKGQRNISRLSEVNKMLNKPPF